MASPIDCARLTAVAACALVMGLTSVAAPAYEGPVSASVRQWIGQCAPGAAPDTLWAVMRVESGANPWAIGINGAQRLVRQPLSREEAVRWARWLVARGFNVDAGLMQINVQHWARFGLTPDTVFDACLNLRAAATILTESYARARGQFGDGHAALLAALSAYNTGSLIRGLQNGYVRRVLSQARRGPA